MNFLTDEKFLIPLLATLGASLAVIGMQFIAGYIKDQKKKIYAATYMLDVSFRILSSMLIVKNHTIVPHIEATERIADGDEDLLRTMFLSDEFDILKAEPPKFSHLPNEFKLLVGYDDIEIVQIFDTLVYGYQLDENRVHLNEFVKHNLKSTLGFLAKDKHTQSDVLFTYHDLLTTLDHEANRTIHFAVYIALPRLEKYIGECQFLLFSTKNAKNKVKQMNKLIEINNDSIPEPEYMGMVRLGGIQGEL